MFCIVFGVRCFFYRCSFVQGALYACLIAPLFPCAFCWTFFFAQVFSCCDLRLLLLLGAFSFPYGFMQAFTQGSFGAFEVSSFSFFVQQESIGFLAFEVGQERVLEVPHLPSVASSKFGSLSSGVSWPRSSSCSPSRCNDPLEGRQKEHSSAKLLKVVSWIRDICDPASAPSESCKNGFSCRP